MRTVRNIYGNDAESLTLQKHERELIKDTREKYSTPAVDPAAQAIEQGSKDEQLRMAYQKELLQSYH